jgi:Ca2+-binding EF-hand superfamily protein
LFALSLLSSAAGAAAEPRKGSADGRSKGAAERAPAGNAERDEAAYRVFLQVADADKDERVSATELEQAVQVRVLARVEVRFKRLDRDGNGKVTHAEVPRMDSARFARFDSNADGSFTRAELAGAMTVQTPQHCQRLLGRLDFDGDGALSVADLDVGGDQRVARLDLATLFRADASSK